MKRILWAWWPAVLQMLLIFAASSIPNLTTLPGDLSDKAGHFVGYAILGACTLRATAGAEWRGVTARAGWQAWLVAAVYGGTDEFHQRFVSGRTASAADWVADVIGAATLILVVVVAAVGHRRESSEV